MRETQVPVLVPAALYLVAGYAVHVGLQALVRYRRRRARPGVPAVTTDLWFGSWALSLAADLALGGVLFGVEAHHADSVMFLRSVALSATFVLVVPVAASFMGARVPRWWLVVGIVATMARATLFVTTDLVSAHRVDAAGHPLYGPLTVPTTVGAMVALVAGLGYSWRRWPPSRERRLLYLSCTAAFVAILAALALHGTVMEVLTVVWAAPIVFVLDSIGSRRLAALETEHHRLEVEREHAAAQLAEAELAAQRRERTRLSDDLHDGPLQTLTAAQLQLGLAHEALERGATADALVQCDALERVVPRLAAELRAVLAQLRPVPEGLDAEEQAEFLHSLVCSTAAERVRCDIDVQLGSPLGADRFEAVDRVIAEALVNARKHARATSVGVHVVHDTRGLSLRVTDDGVGFDLSRRRIAADHAGLSNLHRYVGRTGGALSIRSAPGHGTTLHAVWPPQDERVADQSLARSLTT